MTRRLRTLPAALLATAFLGAAGAMGQALDPLAGEASWKPSAWDELRAAVLQLAESEQSPPQVREELARRWPQTEPAGGFDRLDLLVETFALVIPEVRSLLESLQSVPRGSMPAAPWLEAAETPPLVRANCRLFLGRWAARRELYDEAIALIGELEPADVADPAGLLFYQAVCRQRLLDKEGAMEAVDQLLRGEQYSPRRYAAVARLLRGDLEQLQEESLDHIARRMDDIRRRLELGRAGRKVQTLEEGVIESLDKLIEKIKQQQQAQQAAQSGGPSGNRSAQPAQDSRIMPGRGPGEVTKKDIGAEAGWGDLPPKEREAALQEIGREFPAHYRDAVEQYFRRLAGSQEDRE